jgi:hypothetical protein
LIRLRTLLSIFLSLFSNKPQNRLYTQVSRYFNHKTKPKSIKIKIKMLYSIIFTVLVAVVGAAPIPDGGSAYTGAGGTAVGGNKSGYANSQGGGLGNNGDLLNAFSGNAGDGGKASSGNALGGDADG